MSFSDYKSLAQVQQEYEIRYHEENFLAVADVSPSAAFLVEFRFNIENLDIFSSEAARCELLILPILREVYKDYADRFSLWVQKPLLYDAKLSGVPDYMLSRRSPLGKTVLGYPLLLVVEAKRNDFEQGWGQCLSELVAAQKLNDAPAEPVYGIVTDGRYWEFGKLEQALFTRSLSSFAIDDLNELFGALQFVFSRFEAIAAPSSS